MRKRAAILASLVVVLAMSGCAQTDMPVSMPTLSPVPAAERERLHAQQDEAARDMLTSAFPTAQVSDVDMVRYVDPSEWAEAVQDCMIELGFGARVRPDGGIDFDQVDGQEEANAVAYYTCSIRYPIDPDFARPLNQTQLEYLYDYYVNDLTSCLEDEGYAPGSAPSLITFVEQFDQAPWSPYDRVSTSSESEWIDLTTACPQTPDGLWGTKTN